MLRLMKKNRKLLEEIKLMVLFLFVFHLTFSVFNFFLKVCLIETVYLKINKNLHNFKDDLAFLLTNLAINVSH